MINTNLFRNFLFASFLVLALPCLSFGQVSITLPSFTYFQDFNTLTAGGAWTNNTTIPGWYASTASYIVSNGSGNSGALYSFGTSTADRALGSIGSNSSGTIFYGVRLKNNTANTLTSLTLTYDGEQWRNGGNTTAQSLSFSYQVGATVTSVTTGSWTAVSDLNFTGPVATASAIQLDGDASANRVAGISTTILLSVPAGQEVMLRWQDLNDSGNDHGLAIDNFEITAIGLPVSLINFDVKVANTSALLSFSTATEHNNAYFSIERSTDGTRFETIGKVNGAGTSTVKQEYTFTDERPLKGINFYRLKQVDFDGQFSYSPVVSANIGKVGGVKLSPQPVVDRLSVALEQPAAEAATWQVYDFAGRLLQSGALEAESTNFEISTTTLAEGTYVLRLVNGQQIITQQFQKN